MKGAFLLVSPFILLLLLLVRSSSFCSPSFEEICKKVVPLGNDYDFCVTTLQVVPKSHTANLSELAIIATELTRKNYTYTLATIQVLLKKGEWSHSINQSLTVCHKIYDDTFDDIQTAIDYIKFDNKLWALVYLANVNYSPINCEDAFAKGHDKSLIAKENDIGFKISSLARNITYLLD